MTARRKRRGRLAAVVSLGIILTVAGSGLAGPGVAGSEAATAAARHADAYPAGGTIHWGACHNSALPSGYQCATLAVPVDGEEVGDAGPTFGLALDRHRATGTSLGSLLVNPGGPGISTVDDLPSLVGSLSSTLVSHFDIVGFDPPGVGASDPVTCLSSAALGQYLNLDPAPPTAAGVKVWVNGTRAFAQGCEARSKTILPHVSTVAAARDMDRIRQALGETKLTYLGFSYGTLLGATYAQLYPTRVRAMALDGALNPDLAPVPMIDAQAEALDAQFRELEASCAESSSCPWRAGGAPRGGAGLASAFQALLARVRAHPLRVAGTTQTVGPAELLYGTAAGLYSTETWSVVEDALAQASRGNGQEILSLADDYEFRRSNGTYENVDEAEEAVDCLDYPAPSVTQVVADGRALEPKAPVFGLLDLYSEITCSLWPVPATGRAHPVTAAGSPPIVVVGSTGDPITPYAWAVSLAHQLRRGVLLTRVGAGHTAYGASSCIQRAVDKYLVDLVVPPAGQRCPSD